MNPPSNAPGQQGDPSWVVTDTWDHPTSNNNSGAAGNQYQGGGARPAEWDWDNQMLLVQQTPAAAAAAAAAASAEVDADRKPQVLSVVPTATLCNNRPYGGGNFSTPQSFQQHTAIMGNNFNPPSSIRSYGLDFASEYHGHPSSLHTGLVSSLGQPAATPSELNAELRSYDQRRRFLGMHMLGPEHKNVLDFVKREDMYSMGDAAHARIGLNLGGRTYFSAEDSARLGKRSRINSLTHAPMCQVQGCTADLGKAKHYHRRHKVCEIHSKAPNVIANGQTQRFCQQCSRFHQLSEFDDTKRSCRKRLADHNRRRRKPQHSAVVTISESFKTEEQSTNMRAFEGDHKSILINMQKSGSPSASITDRGSISSGGNRLQNNNQPPTFGTVDDKLVNRSSLLRGQAMPSSDVQALVLSVVSRTPSSAQSTRQSPGTQESVYQHYLHGPSLSLSSAGMGAAQTQHNSPSGQSYSSMEPSVPWLGSPSGSRSTLVQARSLQGFPPGRDNQHLQHCNPQYMLQPKSSDWVTREQLGRLGLQSVQGSMDGHQMLALIENPGQHLHSSVHDVKPLQHSEMQSSGVRSSFGSSFYDSSSSIG